MKVATLMLEWKKREGGGGKTERHFLDFNIDGESLWERLDTDFISCLGWLPDEQNEVAVQRILSRVEADFPDGRRSLYICPECGDLSCGAITVVIERINDEIIWRDFGFQNSYEQTVHYDDFACIGPFVFNAAEYYRTVNSNWIA